MSVAHELTYSQGRIDRRVLALGERASHGAFVVDRVDDSGDPVFAAAGAREAPDGWVPQLKRALVRAAIALGFEVSGNVNEDAPSLHDASTREEFEALSKDYITDAERALEEARAELELRRREVSAAAQYWRK